MKKRILTAGVLVSLAVTTFLSMNLNGITTKSNTLLANVEALAQAEPVLPSECHDKYSAYATTFHKTLERFRPCDTKKCTHIWAYHPRKRTVCKN